jgi:hypothetical protein
VSGTRHTLPVTVLSFVVVSLMYKILCVCSLVLPLGTKVKPINLDSTYMYPFGVRTPNATRKCRYVLARFMGLTYVEIVLYSKFLLTLGSTSEQKPRGNFFQCDRSTIGKYFPKW